MKARLVGISLFCAVLWCNIPTGATTPTDTVLAVTPSDARYLVYYDLVNMFDSVSVRFTYGEILLVHGQQKTRIYRDGVRKPNDWVSDTSTGPYQHVIANEVRWKPITIQPGTNILHYFRNVSVSNCCFRSEGNPTGKTSAWNLLDRTECYLVAKDVVTDTIVFVADTIGVDSCNHATYPCVFGKAPWSRYHSFTVPSSAVGKTVYFAVDAYRYGTSPYGMSCVPSRSDVALSLVYPNDSAHTISADAYNELYTKRSTRLFTLLDFLWEAYCYIPDLNYVRLTQEETDTLHARYFVADTVINGRQIWTAKPGCIGDSCTSFEKTVRFNDVRAHVHVPGSNILRVTGVQTDNSGVQLTLHADRTIHLRAAVYDVLGRENKHTPSTLVNAGIARLEVGLEGLQSGPVFIVLFDQHSTVLATIKVLR